MLSSESPAIRLCQTTPSSLQSSTDPRSLTFFKDFKSWLTVSFSNVVPVISQMITPITNNYTFPCPPLLQWSRSHPPSPSAMDWIECPQISYAEALPLIWWYLEMGHLGGNQVWMRSWGWSPMMGLVRALIRRHQKACFLSVSMHMHLPLSQTTSFLFSLLDHNSCKECLLLAFSLELIQFKLLPSVTTLKWP